MHQYVQGNFIDESAVIYRKKNLSLQKGLLFRDGSVFFPEALHFGKFHCGLAGIDTGKSFGYINRIGAYQIPSRFMIGEDFSQDRALVSTSKTTLLLNTSGEVIKNYHTHYVTNPFNGGYALIVEISLDGESRRDAFIDRAANIIFGFSKWRKILYPGEFNNPNDFYSEGLIRIIKEQKYGFANLQGEIVIEPIYELAFAFQEGLAMVKKEGRTGFINKNGDVVIPFEFLLSGRFSEGLAAVNYEDKWGCIDKNCNTVIPFEYDALGEFNNNEIDFSENGKWGLMNRNKDIIVNAQYDTISHFGEGILEFTLNSKMGVRDRGGNELTSSLLLGAEYNQFN